MLKNFVEKNDKLVSRFLEILLGVLTWSLLLSPIWLGLTFPSVVVYILTFLTVYWSYMAFRHAVGLFTGYRRYREEMATNWYLECQKLDFSKLPDKETLPKDLEAVRHIIIVPVVNEPEEVLRDSIDSIINQTFPSTQISLVFTVEQKYSEEAIARIKKIIGEREKDLSSLMFFVHPAGIPGEAIGDGGANRAWGSSHAVEELRKRGEIIRNYVFSNIDSDHVLDRQYIARLTHLYLSSDRRDNHFYSSAIPLFNNNLWRVPLLMRLEANSVTLGVISDWAINKGRLRKSFSAFSVSLQTLIDANYFDVALGADDTVFYWRAFFARSGDFDGIPHYIPYSADAVEGKNFLDSHRSLYKQLLRWGWGAIDFPLSVKNFLKKGDVKLSKKVSWFTRHIKERVILTNIVFLITFGFAIVTLVNPYVKQSNFAYSLPKIMSFVLTLTMAFMVPGVYFRRKFSPPFPENWGWFRRFLTFLETPLITINLLTYSFFPTLHAQTMLVFGKRFKDLYHTQKVR
jgi:hypothetical protein